MQQSVTVIYGGTDGLGLALSKQLLSNTQLVIIGRNREKLDQISAEYNVVTIQADMRDESALSQSVTEIMQRFGRMDKVVFCAGLWMQGMTGEYSYEDIMTLFSVNTIAPLYLTQRIAPIMQVQGGGQLVYILSKDARYVKKNRSMYHATKWALDGFVGCLREDLKSTPLSVLAVYPGLMQTELFRKNGTHRDVSSAMTPEFVASQIIFAMHDASKGSVTELHLDTPGEHGQVGN